MAGAIRELPQDTRDKLRSTFLIQTLPSCIIELVQNALDAQAASIEVAVSLANWECRVIDNGTGIDIANLGLVGNRYYTSKHDHGKNGAAAELYGYCGEAMSSIADMALVEIITRHTSSTETHAAIVRGGERLYVGSAKHGHRSTAGTTVIVRDLFYKWPVRRKQAESSPSFVTSTLSQIRKHLEALAIINHNVAFQLHDLDRKDDPSSFNRNFSVSTSAGIPQRIASLYGKHLVKNIDFIEYRNSNVKIQGFISLQSTHTKKTQFIYINRRCVSSCDLHQHINSLFGRSAFARRAEIDARQHDREVSPRPAPFLKQTDSPKKQINRYPVFCISMKVPAIKVSFVNEPNKQVALLQEEAAIMVALKDVVCGFLRSHGFLGDKNDVQGSPEKSISSPVKRLKQAPVPVRRSTPIAVPDLPLPEDVPPVSQLGSPSAAARASVIFERGPSSTIEQKTVVSSSKGSLKKASDGKKGNYQQLIDIKYLKRSDRSTHPDEKPAWLQEALTDWSNPVFPPVQKQIRTVETGPTSRPETFHTEIPCDATNRSTIDKEMLHWCNYVAQIDLKFLLFSYITEQSMTLILIDQHAAHERIRVESFLRTYCEQIRQKTVNMVHLSQAKVILLAAREVVELSGMPGCLSQWGFEVSIPMQILDRSDSDYSQVIVKSVPALLADRLVTDDRLLQTILRALLSQEEDPDSEIRLNRKLSWIAMIRNMPSALIDLINSKACRARDLMSRLAETDLPFSCAHGRPSMIPLVTLAGHRTSRNARSSVDWKEVGRRLQIA